MKPYIRPLAGVILAAALAGCGLLAAQSQPKLAATVNAAFPVRPAPDLAIVQADPGVRQIAKANTDFGFRLLARLAPAKPQGNVFFSPFSISQALALTLNGAGGTTRQGIATALGLGAMPNEAVNQANGLLLPSLENPDPQVEMTVANALWIRQGLAFHPDFQARCKQFYDADTTSLDFNNADAASTINDWVSKNTQGKIPDIVSADSLSQDTSVLTNAVYFHGSWTRTFDGGETSDAPFTRADGSKKTLPLMSQEGDYTYLKTPTFQMIRLPYGHERIALYVILPKATNALDALLKQMTAAQWETWRSKMRSDGVNLELPRFKAAGEWELNNPLSQLGMASAFGGGADFAPMGLPGSYIGKVVHKTVLEVNEEGTTAAAATQVEFLCSSVLTPNNMRVDHPFFCAIRDDATGTILFLGAIRDPQ